ncbi:MAG: cation acetate symporter [Armatimonadetes bacterium]|nr:cation acetate symporter [Armatimonadota bacterium]
MGAGVGQVHPVVVAFALVYFAIMIAIGWFSRKASLSPTEYMVAGRKVGAFVNGAALASTYLSPASFLGLPAFVFLLGYSFWWAMIAIILGMPIASMLTAAPLRKYAPVSFTDYYCDRYDDENNVVRIITTIPVIITGILYVTLALIGTALFMMAILQIPFFWSLVIAALVVLFYVYLGGMVSTTWSNAFQGVMMAIAAVCVAIVILVTFGGFNGLTEAVATNNPKFFLPPHSSQGASSPLMASWTGLVSFFFVWHYGFATMPYTVVRFFTTMDINTARRSMFWCSLLGGAMYWGLIIIGTASKVILEKISPIAAQINAKSAMDVLGHLKNVYGTNAAAITDYTMVAATQALGQPWLLGLLVAGGLSVAMSTVAGWLVVTQVILGRDWMIKICKNKWATENPVAAMRLWNTIVLIICFLIALNPPAMVLDLSGWAFVVIIASVGPGLVLGIWWDRATKAAHLWTTCIFTVLTFVTWLYAKSALGSPHWFFLNKAFGWKITTGHQDFWIPVAFIFFIIVSLLTKPAKPETIQKYSLDLRQD